MSQHYIVLRMASSRDLQDERYRSHSSSFAGTRPRYYSTPVDLRDVSPSPSSALPNYERSHLQAPLPAPLTVASNRVPTLRRATSAAVRSTGDIAALSSSKSNAAPRALHYHAHDYAGATSADRKRNAPQVRSPSKRFDSVDDALEHELQALVEEEDDDATAAAGDSVCLPTAPIAPHDASRLDSDEAPHYAATYYTTDDAMDIQDETESAGDACRLSKDTTFVVAAFVVLFTSGGLILGFGPIYAALVREGQWSELCRPPLATQTSAPCAAQEIYLQYVFSTSFLCLSAANAVFGVVLDVCGPRVTALVGLALALAGNMALATGDSASGTGAYIIGGYALVGAGGMGAYLAAFQLLQLFRVQGVVCSTLASLFNCSGYIYMALELDGVTREAFFQGYTVLVAVSMALCFLLFPTNSIVRPAESLAVPCCRIEVPQIKTPTGLVDGMKAQLQRSDLWYFAVFFGWISLIFAFAGGAIPSLLVSLAPSDDPDAASAYTSFLYPVIVNGTFLYSPLVGYVIDRYGFKAIFFACLALVQLFITLLLVPSLPVQLLTFVVYAMAQACLYSLQFAYIMMCFPPELNGTLQAFMATVAFAFGLLNYVLNPWAQTTLHGDYTVVLTVLALPTLLLYVFVDVVQGCEDQVVLDDAEGDDDDGAIDVLSVASGPTGRVGKLPVLSETSKLI